MSQHQDYTIYLHCCNHCGAVRNWIYVRENKHVLFRKGGGAQILLQTYAETTNGS